MNQIKNLSQEYFDKIISVAYGDAGFIDRIKIFMDSRKNPEIKKLLEEYKETATQVHSLKEENYTGAINLNRPGFNGFILFYFNVFIRKPVISTAFALLLIGGISSYYIITKNSSNDIYSQAELIKAERELNESLSIVNEYFSRTSNQIENNVIKEKVNEPIKNSLSVLNNYLMGG